MNKLNLGLLKKAVGGEYAAIRRVTRLDPQGDKVYPPTYEGGEYADEKRTVRDANGALLLDHEGKADVVETVLLDSVQSQANRLELAILRAYDTGRIKMPLLQVDFAADSNEPILKEIGRITALEAPHRMCDAIFRDSTYDGRPFRQATIGTELNSAKAANATSVFKLCPTALLFGFWDSTGPRGGLGAKIQRAIVSEIVGYQSVSGKRTSSRIDPLQIDSKVEFFAKAGGGWTFDPKLAEIKNGEPVKRKPSEINHGNITPSFKDKNKVLNHGGVTLAYAIQNTVLSLAALRRLRFPLNGLADQSADIVGRTVLAALGIAAISFLDEDGFDLRSRCLLDGKPGTFEFVGRGETNPFHVDSEQAVAILNEAVVEARGLGLPWPEEPVTLRPSADLIRLVLESRQRSMSESAGN